MSFGAHLARIWRRWFLVVPITVLAGLVAFGSRRATCRYAVHRHRDADRHVGEQFSGPNSRPVHRVCRHVPPAVLPEHAAHPAQSALGCVADRSRRPRQSPIIFISATAPDAVTAQRAAAGAATAVPPSGKRQPAGQPAEPDQPDAARGRGRHERPGRSRCPPRPTCRTGSTQSTRTRPTTCRSCKRTPASPRSRRGPRRRSPWRSWAG